MVVIEFCGNPGCGKSTLCASLLDEIKRENKLTYDYNELKEKHSIKNIKHFFSLRTFAVFVKLVKYGSKNAINKRTLIYSFKCAIVIKQLTKWSKKEEYDFVLFDEGIIQYLSTLSHNMKINDTKQIEFLREFYASQNIYVINCTLNEDENIRRLNFRNRNGDRFVHTDINIQRNMLKLKRYNLDCIINTLNPVNLITISTEHNDENLSALLKETYSIKHGNKEVFEK